MSKSAQARNSRAKGAKFERDVAHELLRLTGVTFKRDLRQTRVGHDLGDLIPDDDDWPFVIECKLHKTLALPEWRRQAEKAAKDADKVPAVVYRQPRGPVRVSIPLWAVRADTWGNPIEGEWIECSLEAMAYVAREVMA